MGRPRKAIPELDSMVEIYLGADGDYHAYVTVGTLPSGLADRRHRQGKTEEVVRKKVRALQQQMLDGAVTKTGKIPLLSEFLNEWVANPDADWRYSTITGSYAWAINNWLNPGLGRWRLDLLLAQPDAIETYLRSITRDDAEPKGPGLSKGSVHLIFRVLRAALNDAVRRKIMPRNPIELMTWRPKLEEVEVTPLLVQEVKAILRICEHRRNGTRWSIGLPLGLRQGEALGLPWMKPSTSTRDKPMGLDVDGWLVVRQKAERRAWRHGCTDPVRCAQPHCRTTACPKRWQHGCGKDPAECTKHRVDRCPQRKSRPGCATHRNADSCTAVCKPACKRHASLCPERTGGGIIFSDTKTDAGRRRISLAKPMIKRAKAHQDAQDREREAAGDAWKDFGLVWCQPNGRPIDARADWEDWKALLREAGVRDARVHDGRHTAATMLLLQGVDEQTVMAVMGWSDRRMVQRYQHVIDELRIEASKRIGALLWGEDKKPKKPKRTKKKRQPEPQMQPSVDEVLDGFATDHATEGRSAKIIQFPRSA